MSIRSNTKLINPVPRFPDSLSADISNYFVLLTFSCPVSLVGCCPCLQQHCLEACGWLSIDLLRPWGAKRLLQVPTAACSSQQGQLWGQVRLLGALLGQTLNAPRDGDCRASLDNLLHCLAALTGSKFLHMSCLMSCFQSCPCLLSSLWSTVKSLVSW